jgi:hypothetical protein
MPSIVGKRLGGQTYFYLVESARVDGKPPIVSQQYLGPVDEVIAKLTGGSAGTPVRSQHKRFENVAAGVVDAAARVKPLLVHRVPWAQR